MSRQISIAQPKTMDSVMIENLVERVKSPDAEGLKQCFLGLSSSESPYQWFSEENFERAKGWLDALTAALPLENEQPISLAVHQILDLYRHDQEQRMDHQSLTRAQRAASFAPRGTVPIRRSGIPKRIQMNRRTLALRLVRVPPDFLFPHDVHDAITEVLKYAPANELWLATYIERLPRRNPDPVLYARYGDWYVKIVAWL